MSSAAKKRTRKKQPGRIRQTEASNIVAAAPGEDGRETSGGGRVQSIERAFAIIEAVAESRGGVTLAELSKKVNLHTSTTFHLVRTMAALGYVSQDPQSKRYRIGSPLLALAAGAFNEVDMVNLAMPALETLSAVSGECSHFAVRSSFHALLLARYTGAGPFQISEFAGSKRPLNCTAIGKILLAAMTPETFERYLSHGELTQMTDKSITDKEALRREIEEVRRTGISYDNGEFSGEMCCIAAPVRDYYGRVVGALGISAPIWRVPVRDSGAQTEMVRNAAETLSAAFGYRPDHPAAAKAGGR